MATYYSINPKFYVSVDCIIFGFDKGSLKLLLLKRNFEPLHHFRFRQGQPQAALVEAEF